MTHFRTMCLVGEIYVAKPTDVFWNFTKEFYFQ